MIVNRSKGEDKAQSGDLGNSGKDAGEVNAPTLGVTIGHQASFKFVDAAIAIALNGEEEMTAQDIGLRGYILKTMKFEGTNIKKRAQLFGNSFTPICSFRCASAC